MSDVYQFQTNDDGDVLHQNGDLIVDGGIRTAAYLSLFGGNIEDGGFDDTSNQFWANFNEIDNAKKYRSETQHIIETEPLTSNTLLRIEDAALRDLQWLIDDGIVQTIEVSASIPAVDRLKLDINCDGLLIEFVEIF